VVGLSTALTGLLTLISVFLTRLLGQIEVDIFLLLTIGKKP
jgi:hypothetical protein